ncbi:hypothetical protein UVI_02050900 [Ustilaginoidea virens]|uniref:Uncharacterized protein n=1 Tax=Ustilaginoidea virens TaxID=1159556 RepID=A0A1B5L549_USTVR|nr:hypothetical protein UVI_02050900 [Ustilaginoidea virens]
MAENAKHVPERLQSAKDSDPADSISPIWNAKKARNKNLWQVRELPSLVLWGAFFFKGGRATGTGPAAAASAGLPSLAAYRKLQGRRDADALVNLQVGLLGGRAESNDIAAGGTSVTFAPDPIPWLEECFQKARAGMSKVQRRANTRRLLTLTMTGPGCTGDDPGGKTGPTRRHGAPTWLSHFAFSLARQAGLIPTIPG